MPRIAKGDPKIAVAYIRVSKDTDVQALGAEAQRVAIQHWADSNGITIAQWFVEEVKGASPLHRRPIFLESLGAVAAHGAGLLVVQRLDRFSRDPLTAALAQAELQRHGATLSVAIGAPSGDDPTSELIRSILFAVARFEKEMIKARIKAALAVKRSRGECIGTAPYGARADGKSLVVEPSEVNTIRRLRELRSQGMTIREVVEHAAKEGLRNRAGNPFTIATVHALVRDAA